MKLKAKGEKASSSPSPTEESSAPSQQQHEENENDAFGMQVYSPVDESLDSWPHKNGGAAGEKEDAQRRNLADAAASRREEGLGDDGDRIDVTDPRLIAAQRAEWERATKAAAPEEALPAMDDGALAEFLTTARDAISASQDAIETTEGALPTDDDALAIAIAEQDLPPGVCARDQQEVMMRLMTQRIRRGDRADDDGDPPSPALERRLRDFRFAQGQRRETYGDERPWGILGLYDHLAGIRLDVEWAEDAAWRREHGEPYLSWTDFQKTRDAGWNRPFFTYALLLVCTGVLVASYGLNGWQVEPVKINPMIGPSAQTLIVMGAKQTSLIVNQGEWYRLFSPMVLHAGLIHYFLNMTALWFIGKAVEQCHGFAAAAILFIIPAVGGTILSAIFLPEYISVGASGGIFGLIGACIADICINWQLLFSRHVNASDEGVRFRHMKVLLWLLSDIVVNCLVGLTPFVDNFTHLGGMAYGFLCGLSTIERLSPDFFGIATTLWTRLRNALLRFSGLILSVVLILVTTALLIDNEAGTSPCSSCRYVSCVPFPPWAGADDKWWYCDDCNGVTADAKLDSSGYYSLSMTCPDGAIEEMDLSDQLITDRQWIQKELPMYCRKYCDVLFS